MREAIEFPRPTHTDPDDNKLVGNKLEKLGKGLKSGLTTWTKFT